MIFMRAYKITETGSFMAKLLSGDTFDSFLLEEANLQMSVTWHLDGHLNKSFYDKEEWDDSNTRPYDLVSWANIRGNFRELIRGKKTPTGFVIVFHLKPEYTSSMLLQLGETDLSEAVSAMILNIRYDGTEASIVTGISYNSFTLSKNADILWDEAVQNFLLKKEISFEQVN